ncbi:MAG: hypothetical protein V2I43_02790 [Parvularcula sp.]|jgi:hypothetical protein|nr:hypothetical protein [Parvularcula sp.]
MKLRATTRFGDQSNPVRVSFQGQYSSEVTQTGDNTATVTQSGTGSGAGSATGSLISQSGTDGSVTVM